MKTWKKCLALLTAMLLVLSFTACVSVEEEPTNPPTEQNEVPTEATTEAPVVDATAEPAIEETTEASPDYTPYMGQWYTGSVTLNIEKDNKWNMSQNGDVFIVGQLIVVEEDEENDACLLLYDVEGTEVAKIIMDGEQSMYAELYAEELYDRIEDFFFTREQSSSSSVIDDIVAEDIPGVEEDVDTGTDSDDVVNEG